MKDLMKMLSDKEDQPMSDDAYEAKMAVLEELRELAKELMMGKYGDKLKGMKEVSVAAPDQEGLEKGLEMAQEVVENPDEMAPMMDDEDEDEEDEEDEE